MYEFSYYNLPTCTYTIAISIYHECHTCACVIPCNQQCMQASSLKPLHLIVIIARTVIKHHNSFGLYTYTCIYIEGFSIQHRVICTHRHTHTLHFAMSVTISRGIYNIHAVNIIIPICSSVQPGIYKCN